MDGIWTMFRELDIYSTIFRVMLAVLIGGIIGIERGHHGRAAGLRTHILVCLGSAMTTMIGVYSASVLGFSGDPMRVGAQVVSGIGFLGVGTIIIRDSRKVTGLTTAAGLWATACIGLAIGVGYYIAAVLAFLSVLLTMALFVYLERSSKTKKYAFRCYVELDNACKVNGLYDKISPLIIHADIIPAKSGIPSHIGLEIMTTKMDKYIELMEQIRQDTDVVISIPLNE